MALKVVTAPASEPFTTAEAKSHLRVTVADDDTLIDDIVKGVRDDTEGYLHRALITQTWDLFLDRFPVWEIVVPLPPLQSVTTIKYIDSDGVQQTVSSSDYRVDTKSAPARITPAWGEVWPTPRTITNAVEIRFVVGYGSSGSDIPQSIRQGMLLTIGHLYDHREDVVIGAAVSELPKGATRLLGPHRVRVF